MTAERHSLPSSLPQNRPLILVQGPRSANYWRQQIKDPASVRWVCYDARAKALLETWGAEIRDERYYFHKHRQELLELDAFVDHLSAAWFANLAGVPDSPDFHPEFFFTRTVTFAFVALLRAFYLLEYISQEEEGPVWITRLHPALSEKKLRWSSEESAMPLLLDLLKDRWKISPVYYDLAVASEPPRGKENRLLAKSFEKFLAITSRSLPKHADVLFCGNPALLEPVRKILIQRGIACGKIKMGNRYQDFMSAWKPHVFCFGLLPEGPPAKIDLTAIYDRLQSNGIFRSRGVDLLPAFWHKLSALYQTALPAALSLYHHVKKCLSGIRPQYLVVDEDTTETQRVLVRAANDLGIPTMVVLHGLPGSRLGFVPLEAKRMAVWGDYSKDVLTTWGVSEDRISITGCPKYDVLKPVETAEMKREKNKTCAQFGFNPADPLILIIPGAIRENALELMESEAHSGSGEIVKTIQYFSAIAKEIPQVNFLFKFRLVISEDLAIFKPESSNFPSNIKFTSEGLALNYIRGADLTFSHFSSAALEAIMLKRPVVLMNFSDYEDGFPFEASGLGASVRTYDQAFQLCQKMAAQSLPLEEWVRAQEKLVKPFLYSRDGQAASRIARIIKEGMSISSRSVDHSEFEESKVKI